MLVVRNFISYLIFIKLSKIYSYTDKYDPEDEVLVLLAKNLSTNLFTQLTIRETGAHSGKNFWKYLINLKWGENNGELANRVNRKLEKSRNYAYCTESAHIKVPLTVRTTFRQLQSLSWCNIVVNITSFTLQNYIQSPPVFEKYIDPAETVCK